MIYQWFVGSVAFLLLMGCVAAYSHRSRALRWVVVVVAVTVMPAGYFGAMDMLSRPKPANKEHFSYHIQKAQVRWYKAVAGKGLYVVLSNPIWDEPRYYAYPWNEETKELIKQLQDTWESAGRYGAPVFMFNPFEPSLNEEDPIFDHPSPPPRLPPKDLLNKPQPKKYEA